MKCSKKKVAAALITLSKLNKNPVQKKKRIWVRNWIMRREESGAFRQIMWELKIEDPLQLQNFLRMNSTDFEELVAKIGPLVEKCDTNFRKAISVQERLAVTLRYFATGDSFASLGVHFRMPKCTISVIIYEVAKALVKSLAHFMKVPSSEEEWMKISKDYEKKWNFPKCVGSLDGKHITIESQNRGSYFYNYKGFHSIVLMALVDANYKFIMVSVGCNGRVSDGGVFSESGISSFLESQLTKLSWSTLPGRHKSVPYVIVADDAFPLREYLMKPYPYYAQHTKRIFNYRLTRARRMVESVFGILATVFRLLRRPINLKIEKIDAVVLAMCYLHNFMMSRKSQKNYFLLPNTCDTENIIPETPMQHNEMPKSNLLQLEKQGSNNYTVRANEVRKEFEEYFVSQEGEVPWQYSHL